MQKVYIITYREVLHHKMHDNKESEIINQKQTIYLLYVNVFCLNVYWGWT